MPALGGSLEPQALRQGLLDHKLMIEDRANTQFNLGKKLLCFLKIFIFKGVVALSRKFPKCLWKNKETEASNSMFPPFTGQQSLPEQPPRTLCQEKRGLRSRGMWLQPLWATPPAVSHVDPSWPDCLTFPQELSFLWLCLLLV